MQNTKTGERSCSFVYDTKGGLNPTSVEIDLAVAFWVTEPERWTSIMCSEYIFQCSEYMAYGTEQFKCSAVVS